MQKHRVTSRVSVNTIQGLNSTSCLMCHKKEQKMWATGWP